MLRRCRFCLPRWVAVLSVFVFCAPVFAEKREPTLKESVKQVVKQVKPALVRIHVVSASYRGGREQKYRASGSGAIITKAGHVITNHHVARNATQLFCTLSNREELAAELVGTDPLTDIAIIRLLPETPREFPTVEFGDSDRVRVGDHVMSMGSPMALSQSVTLGIVSNTDMVMPRDMGYGNVVMDGENVGALVKWIAHDAVIYGGNSGGPLVNLAGEIIGINEISMGLGGAIPGNLAKQVAHDLMDDGHVTRSWLGVTLRPLLKHSPHERGVLITGALEGSPGADAGFESGDILIRLAGTPVSVHFAEEMPAFNRLVADLPVGEEVEATVLRDGQEKTLVIKTTQRERRHPRPRELKRWGITARNLSFVVSKELKRPDRKGAIVTSIRPGGPASEAKPSILRRDIIIEVDGQPIESVEELLRVSGELTKDAEEPVPVLATFARESETLVTVVKLGIRDLSDPGLEVKKAWLPIGSQVMTRDIAELMGRPDLRGFRVTKVYSGTTAEAAGIHVGDFISEVDGEALTASAPEDYEELPALIRNYRPGMTADLTVYRGEERLTLPVELIRAPRLAREMQKYRDNDFEFTVRNVTFFDRTDGQWDADESGVVVDEVTVGGWADLGALNVGDLIRRVDGVRLDDVDSLEQAMDAIAKARAKSAVFEVLRKIYTVYLELEPNWPDTQP